MEAESYGPNSKRDKPRAQVKWTDRWVPKGSGDPQLRVKRSQDLRARDPVLPDSR